MYIINCDCGLIKIDRTPSEIIIAGYPSDYDIDFQIKITNEYICIYKFNMEFYYKGYIKEFLKEIMKLNIQEAGDISDIMGDPRIKNIQLIRGVYND